MERVEGSHSKCTVGFISALKQKAVWHLITGPPVLSYLITMHGSVSSKACEVLQTEITVTNVCDIGLEKICDN